MKWEEQGTVSCERAQERNLLTQLGNKEEWAEVKWWVGGNIMR